MTWSQGQSEISLCYMPLSYRVGPSSKLISGFNSIICVICRSMASVLSRVRGLARHIAELARINIGLLGLDGSPVDVR